MTKLQWDKSKAFLDPSNASPCSSPPLTAQLTWPLLSSWPFGIASVLQLLTSWLRFSKDFGCLGLPRLLLVLNPSDLGSLPTLSPGY